MRSEDLFEVEFLIINANYLFRIIGTYGFDKDSIKDCGSLTMVLNCPETSYEIR